MSDHPNVVCACSEIVLKSQDGSVKLRSKIIVFKGDQAFAICKGCNSEVAVPVTLKAFPNPPLILRR